MTGQDEKKGIEIVERMLEQLLEESLRFFLVGRSGVGKSSTINSLMGRKIAPVDPYEPTTMEIESYNLSVNHVNFTMIDTPGLCDDLDEMGNNEKYLKLIEAEIKEVDSMCFFSRLDDTRVSRDEKDAIRLISETFEAKVWKNAVIAFTFADRVDRSRYPEALQKRTELIRQEIGKYTGNLVAQEIPSVAVNNTGSQTTPDGKNWIPELYTQIIMRGSKRGTILFILATMDIIGRIGLNRNQKKLIRKKFVQSLSNLVPSAIAIGSVFGPVGAAVGGIVGTILGVINSELNED